MVSYFIIGIIAKKNLNVGYRWPTLFNDATKCCKFCHACQQVGGLASQSLPKLTIIYKMGIGFY
jgi:hypothetical protein